MGKKQTYANVLLALMFVILVIVVSFLYLENEKLKNSNVMLQQENANITENDTKELGDGYFFDHEANRFYVASDQIEITESKRSSFEFDVTINGAAPKVLMLMKSKHLSAESDTHINDIHGQITALFSRKYLGQDLYIVSNWSLDKTHTGKAFVAKINDFSFGDEGEPESTFIKGVGYYLGNDEERYFILFFEETESIIELDELNNIDIMSEYDELIELSSLFIWPKLPPCRNRMDCMYGD